MKAIRPKAVMPIVLTSVIVAYFAYLPAYNSYYGSESWRAYPFWYRCTVLPVKYHYEKNKGVIKEPILDSAGKVDGYRYSYTNEYNRYSYARNSVYKNYCLGLPLE
jgi:hypothetical protein